MSNVNNFEEINDQLNKRNPTMATPTKSPFSYSGTRKECLKTFISDLERYILVNNLSEKQSTYILRLSLMGELQIGEKQSQKIHFFHHLLVSYFQDL
ncbi:hypothetical protein BDAP_002789 [Binucleata daphniae]